MLAAYSRVRLTTDRFESEGARRGMTGYVIEVYAEGDAYEVEFSVHETGITLAQVVVREGDVVAAPESSGPPLKA